MANEGFLKRWWRRRLHHIDVDILWPQLQQIATDRDNALAAFRLHMDLDPSYDGMDEREKRAFLETLP